MGSEKLLDCPFCGQPGGEHESHFDDGYTLIGCGNEECIVQPDVDLPDRAEAIAAWNTRAALARPEGEFDYDAEAAAFYRATGIMAPGKDVAGAVGEEHSSEVRQAAWRAWRAARLGLGFSAPASAAGVETDDTRRGIYDKYLVQRRDGSGGPGGKHEHCRYFVLDRNHDKHARAALLAYAESCRAEYPALAADLEAELLPTGPAAANAAGVEDCVDGLGHRRGTDGYCVRCGTAPAPAPGAGACGRCGGSGTYQIRGVRKILEKRPCPSCGGTGRAGGEGGGGT